jgi:hypothetical protein
MITAACVRSQLTACMLSIVIQSDPLPRYLRVQRVVDTYSMVLQGGDTVISLTHLARHGVQVSMRKQMLQAPALRGANDWACASKPSLVFALSRTPLLVPPVARGLNHLCSTA